MLLIKGFIILTLTIDSFIECKEVSSSELDWFPVSPLTTDAEIDNFTTSYVEDNIYQCNKNITFKFSNMGLTRIPEEFIESDDVKYLYLDNNDLRSISQLAFARLPNLVYVDLSNNPISIKSVFSNLNPLKRLVTLVSNNVNRDRYGNRYGYRYDSYNNVLDEHSFISAVYPAMKNLYLKDNYIEEFNIPLKSLTPNLTHLHLAGNNIHFTYQFFDMMPSSLTHIYLENTNILNFYAERIRNIKHLVLDNNNINIIQLYETDGLSLKNAEQLEYLSVRNNRITDIYPDAFKDTIGLVHLDLSHNKIKVVKQDTFNSTILVQHFTVSHNLLTSVPEITKMKFLKYLDLSNNNISRISRGSFDNLINLENLLLNNNQIENIESNAFNDLLNLKYLDLSANLLTYLPLDWGRNLNKLQILRIENNQFSNLLDLHLNDTILLTDVYLQNNPIEYINVQDILHFPRNISYHIRHS